MATSIAELLDAAAREAADLTAADRVAAAITLGHIGRGLAALRQDGISREVGDLRERQVARLAASCLELAATAPQPERVPRLPELGGALADAAIITGRAGVVEQRWALSAALIRMVGPLTTPLLTAADTDIAGDLLGARALQITQQARRAWQSVCLSPPTIQHNTVLDTPIPTGPPAAEPATRAPGAQLNEAMALLVHTTGRGHAPLTIAEAFAISLTAQTVAHAAAQTLPNPATHAGAAACWAAVRESLRPFHDGSRRPHRHRPAHITAALTIYRIVHDPAAEDLTAELADLAQHLPALADNLARTVTADRPIVALARDLPFREERLDSVLAGNRPGGVIRADARDLLPAATALRAARLTSTALAATLNDGTRPMHTHAAHRVAHARPDAAEQIRDAQRLTLHHLHEQPRSPAHPLPAPLVAVLRRLAAETDHDRGAQPFQPGQVSEPQAHQAGYAPRDPHPDAVPEPPAVSSAGAPPPASRGRTREVAEAALHPHSPGTSRAPGR